MQTFDLIIIGAGSGLNVASAAAEKGLKTAIVEKGPMGGTCLNRGCIPSKIIIHSADVAEAIKKSKNFGINSRIFSINFAKIIKMASNIVDEDARGIEADVRRTRNLTLFKAEVKFVGVRTLRVGKKTIKGDKVIIGGGARPSVPPVEGLKDVDYITSDEALRLTKQPKIMTIIGGGYIAAELAHFYGALGTKISIIQRNKFMIPDEDNEIREVFTKIFKKKYNVLLEYNAVKVSKKGKNFVVIAESKNGKNKKRLVSDCLLVASGRVPNTDILDVKKTGVEVNEHGFVKTNDYLETTARNIWALGDIAGKYLFKHSANLEAQYAYNNAVLNQKIKVDYTAMPHAIFSSPQVAGVGLAEQELKEKKNSYAVGKYYYKSTGMGTAIQDNDGFVKIYADRKTRKILGCHILGSEASTLIHEVIVAMKAGIATDAIKDAVHIHPALSEVVQRAVNSIEW